VSTIKSSREIDTMFRGATKAANPVVMVLVARTPVQRGRAGRVAFVAGKRLGNAVFRNRCRRVLRESVRRCGGPWPEWDVVVVARAKTAATGPDELDSAVRAVLERVGVQ
jgi:ribonuclease P protein component